MDTHGSCEDTDPISECANSNCWSLHHKIRSNPLTWHLVCFDHDTWVATWVRVFNENYSCCVTWLRSCVLIHFLWRLQFFYRGILYCAPPLPILYCGLHLYFCLCFSPHRPLSISSFYYLSIDFALAHLSALDMQTPIRALTCKTYRHKYIQLVHEPVGWLVPFWVASSPIHFRKAQNFYFMKKSGGHVKKVA